MKVKVQKKWYPISLFKQSINHKKCYMRCAYGEKELVSSVVIVTYGGTKYSVTPEFGARLLEEED